MNDIVGRKFGKLTVIEKTDERYVDGSVLYLCKCECGKEIKSTSSRLKSGHIKACGDPIHQVEDLTGKKFGRLTVASYAGRKNNKTYWNCTCECGNNAVADSYALKNGSIVSYGCRRHETITIGQDAIRNLDVDGTNLKFVSPDRKMNRNNTTGIRGVSFITSKQKYRAQITFKGKAISLGDFDNIEDVAEARKQAEEELFNTFLDEYKKIV